jgi:P4 family phage/plasmid primase-like protien
MTTAPTVGTVVEHAARLRALGFALCRPGNDGKNPNTRGWSTRSSEPDEYHEGDNCGIQGGALSDGNRPGHALSVIDLDSAKAIELADQHLPPTDMIDCRPGKPRSHRYYLVPVGTIPSWAVSTAEQGARAAKEQTGHAGPFLKRFKNAATGAGVLDFIGTGGQVACPPSLHVRSGERREWQGGAPGEPTVVDFLDLWHAACDLAAACGAKLPDCEQIVLPAPPRMKTWACGTDLERRAEKYLATIPGADAGQGGHAQTFYAARVLAYGFDLGPEAAYRLLRDVYNPKCSPPWSEAELWHKAEDADRLPFGKPRGWLRDAPLPNGTNRHPWPPAPSRNGKARSPESGDGDGEKPADETPTRPAAPHLTDAGNARRVVARHGADLHYVFPWKAWHFWDGRRWREDLTGEAVRRVKDTQAALYDEAIRRLKALHDEGDDDEEAAAERKLVKALLNHALKWEDARAIARSLELARSEPGIPVLPEHLDCDPFLLNVENGTLDLRTGELWPHRQDHLLTKLAPVTYDPGATCPLWLKFLGRVMDGNADLVTYLQRVVGYALTGDVSEQVLFFFHGAGANGKSTFLGTVKDMLGDYAMQAVSELLMVKHNEAHPTERADLAGRRLVATIETENGKRMAEALMKQMTGGDKVRARKMHKDFFEFTPTWKLFMAANHKPVVTGTDHAVWRRIKLVPFTVTIPDDEKDKRLPEKLKAEWPGILAWAVRGCLDWQKYGLGEPDEVRVATDAYRAEQDLVAGFISECCFVHPSVKAAAGALFDAYCEWSGDKLLTQKAFGQRLRDMGYEATRGHGGVRLYHGIGVNNSGVTHGDTSS